MKSSSSEAAFDWTINENRLWPPKGRPTPPFGPTFIEIMRSCTLRICFETSKGYERKTAYAARVGTAFHQTLQSLTEHPITSSIPQEIVEEASHRFREALEKQEIRKNARPREQTLTRNEERIQRAQESIAVEALRQAKSLQKDPIAFSIQSQKTDELENQQMSEAINNFDQFSMAEILVQSQDGLLTGRIDYAERLPHGGIRLSDYKSALRDDLPERYERQIQIYALLWYETFGEWPDEALVIYPFTGRVHKVTINPEICQSVGQEARLIVEKVQASLAAERLASPGTVCTVCEFRPWCKPFWKWQASHAVYSEALEKAVYGFEGTIITIDLKAHHWKLVVKWREAEISIVVPQERFSHLEKAYPGMRIRALDIKLRGQRYRPQAIISENSELFLITES